MASGARRPEKTPKPRSIVTMRTPIRNFTGVALLCAALTIPALAETAPAGAIDFGKLTPAADGGQFVEVNIKGNLLNMAARLAAKEEPELADLLKGIQSIRVNVVGLDDGNRAETQARIKAVRGELDTKGWERVVAVSEKDQDVGIYLKTRGQDAVEGLVVTVIENGKQAVLVNIVGDIRPEKLADLGEKLGIEPLKNLHHTSGKQAEKSQKPEKSEDKK